MQNDTNPQPQPQPQPPTPPPTGDLPQPPQIAVAPPQVDTPPAPPQPVITNDPQSMVGMSASQMGFNQPPKKAFNIKGWVIKGVIALGVLIIILAVLVFTNIIPLNQFKTLDYVNTKGSHYSLQFYTKHTTGTLKSGSTQLVSKVSKDGKLPLTLAIDQATTAGYSQIKDCGSNKKVFDVQNDNLKQKISVCNLSAGQGTPNGVYIAGILYNDNASTVIISQDLSGVDLSSSNAAQQSLTKFGLEPYHDDIKKIIASIKIE